MEINSSNKGFLPPRVALTATNAASPVTSPATGLLVYNTATAGTSPNSVTPGYYYWNGTAWINIIGNGVPYSGATGAVNLGTYDLTVNGLTVGLGSGGINSNTATGFKSLYSNTTGAQNIAHGWNSLYSNTTGSENVSIGWNTLSSNTVGWDNVAIGNDVLSHNTTGNSNVGIGVATLRQNNANDNLAIGYYSLEANVSGTRNEAFGKYSMRYNTGSDNDAFGNSALYSNQGGGNVAFGGGALYANTTGSLNTAVGYGAAGSMTTGSNNTALGQNTLRTNSSGSYNTVIGNQADVASSNLVNATAIGSGAIVAASNSIQLGNSSVTNVNTNGAITANGLGLGTISPDASSIADFSSTTKGFLPPRMTDIQRDAINNPAQGLIIYCTTCGVNGEWEGYNGSSWTNMTGGSTTSAWTLVSSTTHNFSSAWSQTLAATNTGKQYKLVVSGTWGIANNVQHRDAAYGSDNSNNTIGTGSYTLNQGCDANWNYAGACHPPIPTPSGYSSSHIYTYLLGLGVNGGITISFTDGNYGDNTGSLQFDLYIHN